MRTNRKNKLVEKEKCESKVENISTCQNTRTNSDGAETKNTESTDVYLKSTMCVRQSVSSARVCDHLVRRVKHLTFKHCAR